MGGTELTKQINATNYPFRSFLVVIAVPKYIADGVQLVDESQADIVAIDTIQ